MILFCIGPVMAKLRNTSVNEHLLFFKTRPHFRVKIHPINANLTTNLQSLN